MSRADELESLRAAAALLGMTVELVEGGVAVTSKAAGTYVFPTLTSAALIVGAMVVNSPPVDAAVAVAVARYGLSPAGNRAQRRAAGKGGAR